jgi:pyruvate,water dikinase
MNGILPFARIERRHRHLVGGKALALAMLMRSGIAVPDGLCITVTGYKDFIRTTGLDTRIGLELGRLPLAEMRWEEIWDMALRIRNLFLNTAIPDRLKETLAAKLDKRFSGRAVAVRSSSPQEDHAGTSFAGLHES